MKAMGQTVPYAQFQADVTNLPVKTLKGVIAVAQDDEGKSKILVSANENGKYSQIIAEQFFKKVKLTQKEGSDKPVKKSKSEKDRLQQDKEKITQTAQKAKNAIEDKIKTEKNAK